jgi:Tol biopolymer transport system component
MDREQRNVTIRGEPMKRMTQWAVAMALSLGGCADAIGPDLTIAAVDVGPSAVQLALGDTVRLTAYPKTADGGAVSGTLVVTWAVEPAGTVSLETSGRSALLTGLEEGAVTVRATVEGRTGQAAVTVVTPPIGPVAQVQVDADSLALEEGERQTLTATATDALGRVVTGRFVLWTSSDPGVAHVSPLGEVTAVKVGSATISARVDGTTATLPVHVTADYPFDLVYMAFHVADPASMVNVRLNINDPAAEPVAVVPGSPHVRGAAPSPDGQKIAFLDRPETGVWAIFVANRDGSGRFQVDQEMTGPYAPFCGQLAWSPDGLKLAFTCQFAGTTPKIMVVDAVPGASATLLNGGEGDEQSAPSWSPKQPDGSYRIAHVRANGWERHIWSMNDDGTDARRVTAGQGYHDQPAWSPDGSTIAFAHSGYIAGIFVVDPDGANLRRLSPAGPVGYQWSPSWSPDGQLVAFLSDHETYGSGVYQVYTVARDGTRLARRTSGSMQKSIPAWIRH